MVSVVTRPPECHGDIARKAVTAERKRLARELHDVLGHHVSIMGVLASCARRTLPDGVEEAEQMLRSIESASRRAVAEVQAVIGLVRDGNGTPEEGAGGLDRLDDQISGVREAGVGIHVELDALPDVPRSTELVAMRVVQEGLTNVLRHAGPGSVAWVRLAIANGCLVVVVEDDGSGTPQPTAAGSGYGLAGLEERVVLHGGHLQAGPRRSGGFRLAAELPLAGESCLRMTDRRGRRARSPG